MITVSHYLELADVSWCIADTIIGETRDDMALYFIGHAKPNYPVPAIRYDISIQSTGVAVINRSQSTIDVVITKRHHIIYD